MDFKPTAVTVVKRVFVGMHCLWDRRSQHRSHHIWACRGQATPWGTSTGPWSPPLVKRRHLCNPVFYLGAHHLGSPHKPSYLHPSMETGQPLASAEGRERSKGSSIMRFRDGTSKEPGWPQRAPIKHDELPTTLSYL